MWSSQFLAAGALLRSVAGEWRRHWRRYSLTAASVSAFSIVPLFASAWLARGLFWAQARIFEHGRYLDHWFINLIGAEGLLLIVALSFVTAWVMLAAVMSQQAAVLQGDAPSLRRGLTRGLRTAPRALGAVLIVLLAVLVTGLLLAPLLLILRYVWPLLVAAVILWWRLPRVRRDWLRYLIMAFIPLGIPIAIVVRSVLALPAIVLDDLRVRPALSESRIRSEGRALVIGLSALASVVALVALETLFGWLGTQALVFSRAPAVLLAMGAAFLVLLTGWLFDVIPAITMALLYRGDDGLSSPPARHKPSPKPQPRPVLRTSPSLMKRTAIALLLSGVVAPYALDTLGVVGALMPGDVARASGPYTFTVNDLGDASDANAGDGSCATSGGVCTLRAAIQEADALYASSTSNISTVTFSVNGTIALSSALPSMTASMTVDGTGSKVLVDGGSTYPVMATGGESNVVHLKNFTVAHGLGTAFQGGGLTWGAGGGGTVTDMTFLDNVGSASGGTSAGGGAIMIVAGSVAITNSTFDGDSVPSGGNGGADVLNSGGAVSLDNVTIWASYGGSLQNPGFGSSSVNNSLIFVSQAGFSCDSTFTGANNIADDAGCSSTTNLTNTCATNASGCSTPAWVGAIGDYGGYTNTINLLPGTTDVPDPALGYGASCEATDQRGVTRASACDAGAYELDTITSIALALAPDPSAPGQPAHLVATVTPANDPGPINGGSVTFYQNGSSIGSSAVSGGQATFDTSTSTPLDTGAYAFKAQYAGGSSGWSDSAMSAIVTDNVPTEGTGLAVTSNESSATALVGDTIQFTATLTATNTGTTPGGTVQFFDGATSLGTTSLSGGTLATVTTSALSAGLHSITATYSGDAYYASSTSPAFSQDVRVTETAAVSSSGSPSVYGNSVTFTATMPRSGTLPKPSGTATFIFDGTTSYVDGVTNGTSTQAVSNLDAGSHSVKVSYSGDDYYMPANSATSTQVITQAATATSLATSTSTSPYGATVTLTATVTPSGTPVVASGTVQFYDGATLLGSSSLNGSGHATLSVTTLAVGSHSLTAKMVAGTDFGASTSAAKSVSITSAASTAALSLSSAATVYGQPLTLTATVTATYSGTPSGTVTFYDGATSLGTASLTAGSAALVLRPSNGNSLNAGSHSLHVVYGGDGSFSSSTSATATETVSAAPTSAVVGVPSSSPYGTSITFTATVSGNTPSEAVPPSGTVTFYDGATVLGTASVASNGVASFTTSALAAGAHSISASFAATSNFSASSASAVGYTVAQAVSVTAQTPTATSAVYDHGISVTVRVTSTTTASGFAGTVSFLIDGTPLAGSTTTVPSNGVVTTTVYVPVGTHTVAAVYSGNGNIAASTSATFSATVTAAPTTTTVVSSANPVLVFSSITFTATVSAQISTETGTVDFYDGATLLGSGAVSNGQATYTTSTLAVGLHTINATYSGDSNFNGSSGSTSQDIAGSTTTIAVTSSANPAGYTESVTFTATVTPQTAGSALTGTITFYDGATILSSSAIDGSDQATYTGSTLTLGDHAITATYSGDTNYLGSSSSTLTQTISLNTVTVAVSSAPSPQGVGSNVTISATASTQFGTTVPGSLVLTDSDTTLGTTTTTLATVALSGNAITYTTSSLPRGTNVITATYAGTTGFSAGSRQATQTVVGFTPLINVVLVSGTDLTYATVPTDVGASVSWPGGPVATGTVTLSDGTRQCTFTLPAQTSCPLTWDVPGTYWITADYAGDAYYAPVTSTSVGEVVVQDPTTTTITSITSPDEVSSIFPHGVLATVDKMTVSWTVSASADATGTVSVWAPGNVCTSTQLTGSCQFTFTSPGTQNVEVIYSGDTADAASNSSQNVNVAQCFAPFNNSVLNPEGTISLSPAFNCGSGTGYVDGTYVTATAHPNANWEVEDWQDGTTGTTDTIQVSATSQFFLLIFQPICDRLYLTPYDYQNTFQGFSNLGYTTTSPAPGCGGAELREGLDSFGPYLLYQQGTAVTITVHPSINQWSQLNDIEAWTGDVTDGHMTSQTVVMAKAAEVVNVILAPHCNTFNIGAAEGGTVSLNPAPNCHDVNGHAGYTSGTPVSVTAHPFPGYWFSYIQNGTRTLTTKALEATTVPANPPTAPSFTVYGNLNMNFYFDHVVCWKLTVQSGTDDNDGGLTFPAANNPVNGYGSGDCPAMGPGYYADGEDVGMYTPYTYDGWTILEWTGGATWKDPFVQFATVHMDRDRTVKAVYYEPWNCETLNFHIHGPGTVALDPTTQGSAVGCPPGQVLRGAYATFTATPSSGHPTVGFSGGDVPTPYQGNTDSVQIYQGNVDVWFCQNIYADLRMRSPSGQVDEQRLSGDYMIFEPSQTCPWGWPVGTKVSMVALGEDIGHTFTGWSGHNGTTPISATGTLTSLTLDAVNTPFVYANYDVICYHLIVDTGIGFDESPRPNCPDTDKSASQFIGGTTVLVHGYDDSDYNFYGWNGPAVVQQGSDPAIVLITPDALVNGAITVSSDYEKKSWTQKASEFFTGLGDDIAIAGKKAVGFASGFIGGYVLSKGMAVLGDASMAVGAINTILGDLGVPPQYGGYLQDALDVAQQSLTFVNSYFECSANWGLGNSSATAGVNQAADVYVKYQKLQSLKKQQAELEAGNTLGLAANQIKQDEAQQALENSAQQLVLGDFSAPSWDKNAQQAWTSGGDQLQSCIEDAVPSYLGLPPPPGG